jgi:hypothetical protein
MKKLINLIALVMLVATNVLTPFSYAQLDDFVEPESANTEVQTELEQNPENETTPELDEKDLNDINTPE